MTVRNGLGGATAGLYTIDVNGNSKGNPITENGIVWTVDSSTFSSTAAMAKGDVFAATGTGIALLPIGTDGYALTCDSTQSTGLKWATAPSTAQQLIFLGSATASASASLTFSSNIFATYGQLLFVFDNLRFSSTSAKFQLSSTLLSSGLIWGNQACSPVASIVDGSNSDTTIKITTSTVSATANQTVNGVMSFTTFESTTNWYAKKFNWIGSYFDSFSDFYAMQGGGVMISGTNPDNMTFSPTTGTITSGTIYCYASCINV